VVRKSTCFGQFLCPSSGVIHCIFGTGTCYTGLTTACVQDQDETPVPSWSSTLAVVKLYMFRAVSLPILRSYSLYNRHWHMLHKFDDSLCAGSGWNSSSILILHASCRQALHVSGSFSVHPQELFTVHSALAHVTQVWRQLACRIRMELQFHPDPPR